MKIENYILKTSFIYLRKNAKIGKQGVLLKKEKKIDIDSSAQKIVCMYVCMFHCTYWSLHFSTVSNVYCLPFSTFSFTSVLTIREHVSAPFKEHFVTWKLYSTQNLISTFF